MNIYVSDISQFPDLSGSELLTDARRARMQRYVQRADKARCLVAGLMLRTVLGADRAECIATTAFGKPYLPGGPVFNLSHSGHKVVLLLGNCDAGVDIEQIAPRCEAVARRVFTPREQAWLQRQSSDEAFYRLWTGKESIMKALGLGFQLSPERFEIEPDSSGPNHVLGRAWYLNWQTLEGHMLCCAASMPNAKPEIIRLSLEDLLR